MLPDGLLDLPLVHVNMLSFLAPGDLIRLSLVRKGLRNLELFLQKHELSKAIPQNAMTVCKALLAVGNETQRYQHLAENLEKRKGQRKLSLLFGTWNVPAPHTGMHISAECGPFADPFSDECIHSGFGQRGEFHDDLSVLLRHAPIPWPRTPVCPTCPHTAL